MVDAKRALVLKMRFGTDIEVIVGVGGARRHHHVGLRYIFQEEGFEKRIDAAGRNLIAVELRASVGEIGWPGRQTGIVIGILDGGGWVINFDRAYAEITQDFGLGGDGQNLRVGLGKAKAIIVDEEKSFLSDERTAEGSAKIVLHQVIVANGLEGAGIHGAIVEKFVNRSVKLIGAGMRDDIDLAAAGASHVRGVAAGFDLKFLDGIGRRTEVLRVEGGIGVCGPVEQEKVRVGASATEDHGRALR